MGLQDKIVGRVATQVQGKTEELFRDLVRIQESMHAHLEKILECQRAILYELETMNKTKHRTFKDEKQ